MRKRRLLASAIGSLILVTGCSTGETDASVDDTPPSGSNAPEEEADGGGGEEVVETTEPEPEPEPEAKFGQAQTYDNGVTVTVSKPQPFEPSEFAAGAEGEEPVLRFTVTVVNNSGAPYDVVADFVTLQSGNQEAEAVFDSENGVEGQPSTPVLDGREGQYDLAFAVTNPKDLVMQYQPGNYELDAIIFVS